MNNPIVAGTVFAVLAAVAFGATAPFIQLLGAGVGPFATAALLYLGAALATISKPGNRQVRREAGLNKSDIPRLLVIAFFGAALAPSLFAWGLQRVSATYGSLLLNGEAVFTVILATVIFHEHIGKRVALAVALMCAGGVVTVAGASSFGDVGLLGSLAIVAAVFSWALDNVLTRPFSALDPTKVVRVKAVFGAVFTSVLAFAFGEKIPSWPRFAGLLACGATGYGLSLRFYLHAQRRIGAGRTGSVFAVAPFVGALIALLAGDKPTVITTAIAAALFLAGVILHVTEDHGHEHIHSELSHDHAHSHSDGHHDHFHDGQTGSTHAHEHTHSTNTHSHPHGPDAHHDHRH